jgi:hypothetical protein
MTLIVSAGPCLSGAMDTIGRAGLWVEDIGLDGICRRLKIDFVEPRGYGDRRYRIQVNADSFKALAEAMIRADREQAIRAFGAALQTDPQMSERHWVPESEPESKAA